MAYWIFFQTMFFFRRVTIPKPQHTVTLEMKFSTIGSDALSMMKGYFVMDSSERLSCAQLIEHAYFERSRVLEKYEQLLQKYSHACALKNTK